MAEWLRAGRGGLPLSSGPRASSPAPAGRGAAAGVYHTPEGSPPWGPAWTRGLGSTHWALSGVPQTRGTQRSELRPELTSSRTGDLERKSPSTQAGPTPQCDSAPRRLAASATKGCASGTTPTATTATCEHGAGACGGGQLRVRPLPCGGVAVATEHRAGRMRRCGRRGRARGVRCLGTSPAPCGSVERALGARNKHVITSVGSLLLASPSCRHRKSSLVTRV